MVACLVALIIFSCKKEIREEKVNPLDAVAGSMNMDGTEEEDTAEVYDPTLKDLLFTYAHDSTHAIVQTIGSGNTRTLVPYLTPSSIEYYLYIVYESNAAGDILNHAYILSSSSIESFVDMESWALEPGQVYKYASGQLSDPVQKKLMARYNSQRFDIKTLYKNAIISPLTDVPVCIDWYWTVWDENNEILSESYLFTTCMGGGSGGTTGNRGSNSSALDSTDVTAEATWVVKGNSSYEILAAESFKGRKYSKSSGYNIPASIFTAAKAEGIAFEKHEPGYSWSTTTHTNTLESKDYAKASVLGELTYPDQTTGIVKNKKAFLAISLW